jgi:hypothetical protein
MPYGSFAGSVGFAYPRIAPVRIGWYPVQRKQYLRVAYPVTGSSSLANQML